MGRRDHEGNSIIPQFQALRIAAASHGTHDYSPYCCKELLVCFRVLTYNSNKNKNTATSLYTLQV